MAKPKKNSSATNNDGAEAQEDDGEPFEEKMKRLTTELEQEFGESRKLEEAIHNNLRGLGFRSEG